MAQKPLIFDIARGSMVDGPGLRTVVFYKGCPLRCVWCHNPESQENTPEILYDRQRCLHCGKCEKQCPQHVIDHSAAHIIRRESCDNCGLCTEVCDTLALQKAGTAYSPDELLEIILRDKLFYQTSGGGVTFSGGEPLLHMDFLHTLVRRLKKEKIHITLQTCGHFPYDEFREKILPWIDLVFFDIKGLNPAEHQKHTGRNNRTILHNLARLCDEQNIVLIPRIPLIPGFTANKETLREIASFFRARQLHSYDLLSYNPSGLAKYEQLGKKPPSADLSSGPLPWSEEKRLRNLFACAIDGKQKTNQEDRSQNSGDRMMVKGPSVVEMHGRASLLST